jgi:hypothetical protein
MFIRSTGNYYQQIDGEPPLLKTTLQQTTGKHFRRTGRFIQLALIGAGRCCADHAPPNLCAVYLTSARGDMEITVDVLKKRYLEGQPPKPLSFINSVSNSACFYIAQHFQLEGRSQFVTSRFLAFENALTLAALDLQPNGIACALIGSVEMCVPPLHEHRARLGLDASLALAEASHWLWLSREPTAGTLGEILFIRNYPSWERLLSGLKTMPIDVDHWWIARGQFLAEKRFATLQQQTRIKHCFDYRKDLAYYDSQSGFVIPSFLTQVPTTNTLLHINATPNGRYCVFAVLKTDHPSW